METAMDGLCSDDGLAQTAPAQAADTVTILPLTKDAANARGRLGCAPLLSLDLEGTAGAPPRACEGQRNEAQRRLSFFQCRQAEGEKFNNLYLLLKQASDEIDLWKTHDPACVETQMKHALIRT